MYLPPGFSVVTPYLVAENADRLVDFLVRGLGGVETLRHLRPDGKIANAQVQFGPATVMVSESSDLYPSMPASLYFYVENADQAVAQALEAGAVPVMEVSDQPYGDRQGGVRDSAGNLWWISQRLVPGGYGSTDARRANNVSAKTA